MGQRIIGLTGGIATGKSTVAQYLASHHGLVVLDADVYARQAVAPGTPIFENVLARYGEGIVEPDGRLNRDQLGQIVFNDAIEKRWLEQQIHPFVRQQFAQAMANYADESVIVQVIPLLFEADLTAQVTEIWVVTCSYEHQLERLRARNNLSDAAARARIQGQWPLAQKVELADVVLDNDAALPKVYEQVDAALAA